jgi:hypothetical protein
MPLRRAAVVTVIVLLGTNIGVPIAEFLIWPSLVDPSSIARTVANIRANEAAYLFASFIYLVAFAGDVVVAWALYYLLRPVNQSLAALTAALRAFQAGVSFMAALHLFTAFGLLHSGYLAALGADQVQSQVLVLLRSFRAEWGLALVVFGVHLGLLGYLVYRSGYIPRLVGVALALAGLGYVVQNLQPYLFAGADIGWIFTLAIGELVFIVWLAIWGWRLELPRTLAGLG